MLTAKLTWEKVLKAEDFDSTKDFLMNNGGLYMWILPGENSRVYYAEETFNFYQRLLDHFHNTIGGKYLLLNPSIDEDYLDFLKEHYDGKTIEDLNEDDKIFCQ